MMSEGYRKRGMDLKRLYLCLQGKLWLFFMLIVAGAVIGSVGYQVAKATRMPITYESVSKLYISFGIDESGEIYQYYNGYTWNDLMDSDPIMDHVMSYIPAGYTRDAVQKATTAEILSDIRLLTITVDGETEKFVREVQSAVENGLVEYAADSPELNRIEVIRSIEPLRVYWDDRTPTAAVIGAVLFGLMAAIILCMIYILDDAVYVESDIEKRYTVKAIGLMPLKQRGLQPYARELKANFEYLLLEDRKFAIIDMGNQCELRQEELELVLNAKEGEFVGGDGEAGGLTWTLKDEKKTTTDQEKALSDETFVSLAFNGNVINESDLEKMRSLNGVVLMLPFGEDVSRKTDRVLTLLNNQECKVLGMVITKADEDFLSKYYE